MVPLSIIVSMIIDSMILNGTIEYHSMIVAFNDSIIDLYQGEGPPLAMSEARSFKITLGATFAVSLVGQCSIVGDIRQSPCLL